MNIEFIRECLAPFLEREGGITEKIVEEVFSFCNEQELAQIKEFIKDNDIFTRSGSFKNEKELSKKNFNSSPKKKSITSLTNEQLCFMHQRGDKGSLELLITKNMGLVKKRANKFTRYYRHKLDFDDLISAGVVGMIKAAQKFKVDLENKYTTYAVWWIDQAITREIMESGFTVRIPVYLFGQMGAILRISNSSISYEEWIKKCTKELGFEEEKTLFLYRTSKMVLGMLSLNNLVGKESDSELVSIIPVEGNQTKENFNNSTIKEKVKGIMSDFSDREKLVIEMRFGLDGDEAKTLQELGDTLGVTRERVRQIETKSLEKIKKRWSKNVKSLQKKSSK